jgi:deazaflavin-dependent oxidoreductase (nitroreductase family)
MDVWADPGARSVGSGIRGALDASIGGADGLARAVARSVRVGIGRAIRIRGAIRIRRPIRVSRAVRVGPAILTAPGPAPTDRQPMEDDLVSSGRFVRIETRGWQSGQARTVTIGFVEDDGSSGALLVAAGSADSAWARNLLAEPACRVTLADRSFDAIAEPLEPAEHARAVRELILRYGTPAEGLGHGTSFRLRPVGPPTP